MSTDEYRRALEVAIKEYEQLAAERQRIDRRLSELAQTIGTLSRLCGFTPTVPWGLTDACRTVLRDAGAAMTPAEIRDRLIAIGCDLSVYSNALAAIHKRLAQAGELRTAAAVAPGKLGYLCRSRDAGDLLSRTSGARRTPQRSGRSLHPGRVPEAGDVEDPGALSSVAPRR
jgi:hypothetical protein